MALVWVLAMLLVCLAPQVARAEVNTDHPLIEDTGYILRPKQLKVGLFQSSYGLTDRIQLDSLLWLNLITYFNLGAKVKVIEDKNLAVAVEAWAGTLAAALLTGAAIFNLGTQVDATVPLVDKLKLHLVAGFRYWKISTLPGIDQALLPSGRIYWPTLKGSVEYDITERHLLFLTLGSPTSWSAGIGNGGHEFDATAVWAITAGYQLSYKWLNLRLDLGYGPSLFGRGVVAGLDTYFRFDP